MSSSRSTHSLRDCRESRLLKRTNTHSNSKVHRALTLHKAGSIPTKPGDFSADIVAKERTHFEEFVDMSPKTWDKVIEAAKELVPAGARRSSSRSIAPPSHSRERAVLREDSDDDT